MVSYQISWWSNIIIDFIKNSKLTEIKVSCGSFSQNPNFEDTAQNLIGKVERRCAE